MAKLTGRHGHHIRGADHHLWKVGQVEGRCLHCNAMFLYWPSQRREFCSASCVNRSGRRSGKGRLLLRTDQDIRNRILARIRVDTATGCWIWRGAKSNSARPGCPPRYYGHLSIRGRARRVHRLAYELWRGKIPKGLEPDHLCRQTLCANPWHLEPVTGSTNALRGLTGKVARRRHVSVAGLAQARK